jgi:hypothetical protein
MKNEFIVKMIKAEMLRYEAIKEIMPDCVKSRVDEMENDFKDVIKQLAFEMIKSNENTKEDVQEKDTRKISVDFDN